MRILTLVLLVFLLSACGYRTPLETDNWAGGSSRFVYVKQFSNATPEPYLDQFVTDALIRQLTQSQIIVLTEDAASAELVLSGVVSKFSSRVIAYDGTDNISEYRALMAASVTLAHKNEARSPWKKSLSREENFSASVNKNQQMDAQLVAARALAQRLAEDIYSSLLYSF